MQPVSSLTSGILSDARQAAKSEAGPRPSATASATLPAVASERLQASHPRDTDKALEASLAPTVTSCLGEVIRRYETPGGQRVMETCFGVHSRCTDPAAAERALLSYERASLPAPEQALWQTLTLLKVKTKSASTTTDDIRFQMQVYARELQQYPADVALHVLKTQGDWETFWPSWAELRTRLEHYAGRRQERLQALRKLVRLSGPDA